MARVAPLLPGASLGRYQIVSRLAMGGMAELWQARLNGAEGFQKKIVIKTMLPELAEAPEFVQLFINEAYLAAQLNHPNTVQVFDFGELAGRYFIAMEYIGGRSLRQLRRRLAELGRPLPAWLLLRVVAAACDALQHAHALGIVHRDISPENIMLSFTGAVKLVDFGVAQGSGGGGGDDGVLFGKFGYLAPERVKGQAAGPGADIYALGVVLYEALAGAPPFGGNQLATLRRAAQGRPRDLRELCPTVPAELSRITMRAMARDPRERYAEAAELAEELRRHLRAEHPDGANEDLGLCVSALFSDSADIPESLRKVLLRRQIEDPALVLEDLAQAGAHHPAGDGAGIEELSTADLGELSQEVEVEAEVEVEVEAPAGPAALFAPRAPGPPPAARADIFSSFRAGVPRQRTADVFSLYRRPRAT